MSQNTTKKPKTARKPSGKIRYEAGGRNMTSQSGLIPGIKFLHRLGFSGLCRRHVYAQHHLVDVVFLVLIGLMQAALWRKRIAASPRGQRIEGAIDRGQLNGVPISWVRQDVTDLSILS